MIASSTTPATTAPDTSVFNLAPYIAPDLIFQVTKNYIADKSSLKVNVGAGTYRDENGQPWVLPSVRMAKDVIKDCGHEYLPIAGLKAFRENVTQLIFHDTAAFREDRVSSNPVIHALDVSIIFVESDCYVPIAIGHRCVTFGRPCVEESQCVKRSRIYHGANLVES